MGDRHGWAHTSSSASTDRAAAIPESAIKLPCSKVVQRMSQQGAHTTQYCGVHERLTCVPNGHSASIAFPGDSAIVGVVLRSISPPNKLIVEANSSDAKQNPHIVMPGVGWPSTTQFRSRRRSMFAATPIKARGQAIQWISRTISA